MADLVFSGTHPQSIRVLTLRGAVRSEDLAGLAISTDPVVGTNLFPARSHKDELEDCSQLTSFAVDALHPHHFAMRCKFPVILLAVIIRAYNLPGTKTRLQLVDVCLSEIRVAHELSLGHCHSDRNNALNRVHLFLNFIND